MLEKDGFVVERTYLSREGVEVGLFFQRGGMMKSGVCYSIYPKCEPGRKMTRARTGGRQDILTSDIHTSVGGFSRTYISAYISSAVEIMFTTTIGFFLIFFTAKQNQRRTVGWEAEVLASFQLSPRIRGWALICRPTLRSSRERRWKSSQRKVIRLIRAWSGSNGWVFAFRSMDGNNPRMEVQHIKQKVPVRVSFITFLANSLQLRFFLCLIYTPQFATHHAQ